MRKIELRYKIITGRGFELAAGFGLSDRFDIEVDAEGVLSVDDGPAAAGVDTHGTVGVVTFGG